MSRLKNNEFLLVGNVKITGVSACVPNEVEEVSAYPLFSQNDASNFSKNTGILQRRKAQFGVCSSDLCLRAAEKLVEELNWNKSEIECLIFVTQTQILHFLVLQLLYKVN